ncbi:phosphonate C-P lyase system protein PhnG [Paracoccus aestuariivivens]|uniref:Phosphonate C-P lyase system protein PhnG n=1 Tax=Paracoccus aestuariivivens TaxID=1820333 RepID=A0A6L6JD64_9RHOB|nr:phosphonate C-P lyase system protein PhnG [Paracoccus aestuariivivens]MTH79108.1 phosphonate C-P lyase system protein PhnG [Paracoccus aestuariivivens]
MTTITRRDWMGVLARSAPARLAHLLGATPQHSILRNPEIGAVMVRGRAGATGAPFNLGEMTVTRCTLQLEDGLIGHAYVQGRDKAHAIRAAIVDAQMQGPDANDIFARIVSPLLLDENVRKAAIASKAAATKVEFFTMVRGVD